LTLAKKVVAEDAVVNPLNTLLSLQFDPSELYSAPMIALTV